MKTYPDDLSREFWLVLGLMLALFLTAAAAIYATAYHVRLTPEKETTYAR